MPLRGVATKNASGVQQGIRSPTKFAKPDEKEKAG